MADLAIKYFSTDDLKPYENNPRHNDDSVDQVAASIREFGWKVPLVIDSDNVIVCGHTRWKAAHRLGIKRVPCVVADDLTDEQIKGFRLADNKTAELSEWDFGRLEEEFKGISMDMSQFGFDVDFGEEPSDYSGETEEDEWDDIENLEDHYGVPYQGNKSRIADRIIALLPKGNRLVDLFGGGGVL